ncbi:MAG: hypothetical protein OEM82_06885 [Acidobacteriota bacterium]|nr:hypothetical protein [Acidobacteriota bacterium]MDH3529000.1 hypothetical protein [Acidobacteriota bacterium]
MATFLLVLGCFGGTIRAECTVTTGESPKLVNLRLGMSPEEVNAALGGASTVKVKKDTRYTHYRRFKKGKAKGQLAGVKTFWIRFFEKRVYSIEVFFHEYGNFQDVEYLAKRYSAAHDFAYENFEVKYGYARAECEGFSVKADYILDPHIEISDTNVVESLKQK